MGRIQTSFTEAVVSCLVSCTKHPVAADGSKLSPAMLAQEGSCEAGRAMRKRYVPQIFREAVTPFVGGTNLRVEGYRGIQNISVFKAVISSSQSTFLRAACC